MAEQGANTSNNPATPTKAQAEPAEAQPDLASEPAKELDGGKPAEAQPVPTPEAPSAPATEAPSASAPETCNLPIIAGVKIKTSTIEKCLELEWQDQREVRNQSWKTIEMSLTIIAGALGAKFVLKDSDTSLLIAVIGGLLLIMSSSIGLWICICHSVREWWIMRIITELERFLLYKNTICANAMDAVCPHLTEKCKRVNAEYKTLLDIISLGDFDIKSLPECEEELKVNKNFGKKYRILSLFRRHCLKITRVSSLLVFYHIILIVLAIVTIITAVIN